MGRGMGKDGCLNIIKFLLRKRTGRGQTDNFSENGREMYYRFSAMGIFAVESKLLYLRANHVLHDGYFEVLCQNPANTR